MCAAEQDRIPMVEQVPLSLICSSTSEKITERNQNRLLRPVFINGVEVGFAYSQSENTVKKLSARGITITLWYFISRGHQAQALLPFCFKSYPDKSDHWDELMALYRMNLLEFTPGFGTDKYVEVNRIMAKRAREYGGCMVARSQMHIIVEQDPLLDRTVEKKLLMPSFNGNDLIFPIDGPLGRNGYTFEDTLTCAFEDPEWPRCVLQQMNLRDQRIWMTNLADITRNANWIKTATRLHPSETNPPENRGFSKLRRRTQRIRFFDDSGHNQRPGYNNTDMNHFSSRHKSWTSKHSFFDSNYYFVPSYRRNPHKHNEKKVSYIGRPNSVYRLITPSHTSANNDAESERCSGRQKPEAADNLNHLANVFGYSGAKSICSRNPNLVTIEDGPNKLAHSLLEKTEQEKKQNVKNDDSSKKDKNEEQEQNREKEQKEYKDEDEDKKLPKGTAPMFVSPEETKQHSSDIVENTIAVPNDGERGQPVLRKDNNIASFITDAELEIELKDRAAICSSCNDTESVAVRIGNGNSDLIYFSDSELENENDHPLREAEILM
ncbi:putative ribonuclease ZC3H12D [Dirofilaria immitis]